MRRSTARWSLVFRADLLEELLFLFRGDHFPAAFQRAHFDLKHHLAGLTMLCTSQSIALMLDELFVFGSMIRPLLRIGPARDSPRHPLHQRHAAPPEAGPSAAAFPRASAPR